MEIAICFFVWTSSVLYSLYNISTFSQSVDVRLISEYLSPGHDYINEHKDVSDFEWNYWKNFAFSLLPWLLIHASLSELLRQYKCTYLRMWYFTISTLFITYNYGFFVLLMMLLQPIIYWCIMIWRGSPSSVWICSVVWLLIINFLKNLYEMNDYYFIIMLTRMNGEKFYMVLVALSWIQLRCISVTLDTIEKLQLDNDMSIKRRYSLCGDDFVNMLGYMFYMPTLFLGPVILYKDFDKSATMTKNTIFKKRIFNLFVNLIRYTTWFILIELGLHFIYFNSLQYDIKIVEMMPNWCLYGGGLWMGLYFYLKYLVTYGIVGSLAAYDGIVPEAPPRCVLRIHLYSQMWKYFDVGLHKFLLKYIYKPILLLVKDADFKMNSIYMLSVKCFASFVCFIFVFLWHGIHFFIFLWSMLNFLGIVFESMGKSILDSKPYRRLLEGIASAKISVDQYHAALSTPLLMISALSNFYFFGGTEVGDVYVSRFWSQSRLEFALMFCILYCSCRVSQYCARMNAGRIRFY